ncbi:MAG TPA: response regulator [Nitrososphaera sp.]|nr:response regulator [Nitrososphaera sp.]
MSSTASDVNIRILVINDEPDILLAMSSILSARGYYVKIFDKAAAALEHLASKTAQYDLVITDYRMPSGISGLDLARSIKKDARKTKVFLMTAFDISSLPQSIEALESRIVDEALKNRFQTKN